MEIIVIVTVKSRLAWVILTTFITPLFSVVVFLFCGGERENYEYTKKA